MSTEEQAAFSAEERARRAKKQAEKNEEELAIQREQGRNAAKRIRQKRTDEEREVHNAKQREATKTKHDNMSPAELATVSADTRTRHVKRQAEKSEEELAIQRKKGRKAQKKYEDKKRNNMSTAEQEAFHADNRAAYAQRISNMSKEELTVEREKRKARNARDRERRRNNMSPEELAAFYAKKAAESAERFARMNAEEFAIDRKKRSAAAKERLARMSLEERAAFNARVRTANAERIAGMNAEELTIYREKKTASRVKSEKGKWLRKSGASTNDDGTITSTLELRSLGAALSRQWPERPEFNRVKTQLQKIQDGVEKESSLLVLDLEFISGSRKALEVGLAEFNSKKVLVNARVNYNCTTEELLTRPDGSKLSGEAERMAHATLNHVYCEDRRDCSGLKTAEEIAKIIVKAGVTQNSIITVWHTSTMDLDLLRELLNSAGHPKNLPTPTNCIPMIPHFRAGLPLNPKTKKRYTAKLDIIFPVLFASHSLVGKNHQALVDAEMLRLMVLLLIQFQKRVSDRDLSDFPLTTQEFVLHGQANRIAIQKWLGAGFTVVPDAVLEAGSAAAAQKNVEDVEDEEDEEDEEDGLETTYEEGDEFETDSEKMLS